MPQKLYPFVHQPICGSDKSKRFSQSKHGEFLYRGVGFIKPIKFHPILVSSIRGLAREEVPSTQKKEVLELFLQFGEVPIVDQISEEREHRLKNLCQVIKYSSAMRILEDSVLLRTTHRSQSAANHFCRLQFHGPPALQRTLQFSKPILGAKDRQPPKRLPIRPMALAAYRHLLRAARIAFEGTRTKVFRRASRPTN